MAPPRVHLRCYYQSATVVKACSRDKGYTYLILFESMFKFVAALSRPSGPSLVGSAAMLLLLGGVVFWVSQSRFVASQQL
jgi:hypothetical protein